MRTSDEINEELQGVLSRLADVKTQHDAAESEASELVRQVALGEAPISALPEVNLKAATLRSVVEELQANRQRLEGDLEAQKSAEAHAALFSQAAGFADEADKAWNDYLVAWKAGLAGIESLAQAVADAQEKHWKSRWDFNLLPEPEAFLTELRDRNIGTEALTKVPVNGSSLNFSHGCDVRPFEGEGWQALAHQVQRILNERSRDARNAEEPG
jgi:hypothetical protein